MMNQNGKTVSEKYKTLHNVEKIDSRVDDEIILESIKHLVNICRPSAVISYLMCQLQ